MDSTSTLTPNKHITSNSPPTTTNTTPTTSAIFINQKNPTTSTTTTSTTIANDNTALSLSPTSVLNINAQSNDMGHGISNHTDLNYKIRRDSIAHSQGMGGVSWGSLTIGSWLRDEVILHGLNNNNSNANSDYVVGAGLNHTSQSKMHNISRNSISYRRLSTIDKLNNTNKSTKSENGDPSNNYANDLYSNFPLNSTTSSLPFSANSTYLPYFETQFCRDYSCCGLSLPGLHDLLRHYEEAHIGYNTGSVNGSHIDLNPGVKKQNNYLRQQYTKQQRSVIIQEPLKYKNNDGDSILSHEKYGNSNSNNNDNSSIKSETIHKDSTPIPTTAAGTNINNSSATDIHLHTINNKKNKNNNNAMMGTSMNVDLMNNNLLNMELEYSHNNNSTNRLSDSTTDNSINDIGSNQKFRNSSIPSSIITNGPLNAESGSNHLGLNHTVGVMDAASYHGNGITVDKEKEEEKDGGNCNNNDKTNNTSMGERNQSFHNLKGMVNSFDVSTDNIHGFHNTLVENSNDLNNLLVDSLPIQQVQFNDNNNNNNNSNNNSNGILGGIGNSSLFMKDTILNGTPGMAHQDPLSNIHTSNNNSDDDIDNDDMNNDGNRVNFIDDPARRLYVMDHEEHKPFKCPVIGCEKTYKNQNGLKYHRLHGHQNQKLLKNPDGTFTVLDPDSNEPYPDGMGYEKDKPYRCEVCGKRYKNLNGLKYHRGHSTH